MPDATPSSTGRRWWWSTPIVAPLLADRRLSAVLAVAGAAQVALTFAHIGGMPCPFARVAGYPCPGCGLSRAAAALCRGDVDRAWRLHAFAPLVLLSIAAFAAAAVLPYQTRKAVLSALRRMEQRWPVAPALLALLFLYWIARIGYAPAAVAQITSAGF